MKPTVRKARQAAAERIEEEWGSLTWLANRAIGNAEGLTLGRVVIQPGMSNPRHSHPNCQEALYLLRGTLEHSVGDDTVVLEAGDTLVVGPGVPHDARNVREGPAEMIVAYSSGVREFRKEG
ncbi:MAG: cupin domain-containing protein [Candidatus Brocadiia bacterium]